MNCEILSFAIVFAELEHHTAMRDAAHVAGLFVLSVFCFAMFSVPKLNDGASQDIKERAVDVFEF